MSKHTKPADEKLDSKALAPLFTVKAVKAYQPATDSVGYETLLPFKRKQIIVVLDWDESRDAIFGEYDGKRGWFPSSHTKIIPQANTSTSTTPREESAPSKMAAARNSIPIENPANNKKTITVTTPKSTNPMSTSKSHSSTQKIMAMLPKMSSTSDFAAVVTNTLSTDTSMVSLKGIKKCNIDGVPLLIENIIIFCRESSSKFNSYSYFTLLLITLYYSS